MLKKLIAGSQTGVNRAVLDAALEMQFPCGGWCPGGRLAEDGELHKRYPLEEAKSKDERIPTELNILEGGATLILTRGRPTGCTALAGELTRRRGKNLLVIDLEEVVDADVAVTIIRRWIGDYRIEILNVTGPRESRIPGIYDEVKDILERLLA